MEEETKLETPEEKAHRKERERFMRQAITQAKKAEKLSADRLCDCVRGKGDCAGL